MKYPTLLGAMLLLALLITACGPATTPTTMPTEVPTKPLATKTSMASETPAVTATHIATATHAATETPTAMGTKGAAESPTAGVPVTGAATINVATVGMFGSALVDGQGHTLYLFTKDTQNGDTSACTGNCATTWPPLMTQSAPVAGTGVDKALLGTITNADGKMQVTYNGWPLYTYSGDTAPGDAKGQGMNTSWYLVSPTGEAIKK